MTVARWNERFPNHTIYWDDDKPIKSYWGAISQPGFLECCPIHVNVADLMDKSEHGGFNCLGAPQVRPCPWYGSLIGCKFGNRCPFRHVKGIKVACADYWIYGTCNHSPTFNCCPFPDGIGASSTHGPFDGTHGDMWHRPLTAGEYSTMRMQDGVPLDLLPLEAVVAEVL